MATLSDSVLVIEDDENLLQLITSLLQRAGYATVAFGTGEEALVAARTERPAVVVLDVKLPGVNGYEVCRELKDSFGSDLPVIFVSGVRTEPLDRTAGLLVGADDYIVKPFDPDEFLARVRKHFAPLVRAAGPAKAAALTPREREVLRLLADGLNQTSIAERLVISPKTVATHIQHILGKLDVHSRAQAVAVAHRYGVDSLAG